MARYLVSEILESSVREAMMLAATLQNVFTSPLELNMCSLFYEIRDLLPESLFLKLEGLNLAGSIKLKPAIKMINALEENGTLHQNSEIIESSSGNLGTALALVCAERGYRFTCVTDPNSSEQNRQMIEAYGGRVIVVTRTDSNGGFLQTRIQLIEQMLKENKNLVWLNQYKNPNNPRAHFETTAPEILQNFPDVDWLFIGAGTTGTLMGCVDFFKIHSPSTKIVAVDAEGSITFGDAPKKRYIPGLGTSRKPEIAREDDLYGVVHVSEPDTIRMCHRYSRKGYPIGGSTGTVLAGAKQFSENNHLDGRIVAISPDKGEKYLTTIYNPIWIRNHFGDELWNELYKDQQKTNDE